MSRDSEKEKRAGAVGINKAAEYLGCHPDTVRRLIKAKKLDAFKVGRDWRIAKTVLREIMRLRSGAAA